MRQQRLIRSAPALLAALLMFTSCQPDPYYDDDIGVEGVPTDPGALAGWWAFRLRYITVSYIPVLGREVESGGDQYHLVTRTWDEEEQRYDATWDFCIDVNHESAGLIMETPNATRDSVTMRDTHADVDHAAGEYKVKNALQLWALRDLPDPVGTDVPTPDNYQDSPQRDWIYDADGDGNIGCTMLLTGFLEGEDYYINRKINQFRGVVVSEDQIFGLVEGRASWSVLESTVPIAVHTGEIPSDDAWQHPDPKRSWFEQVRLDEGATCVDVREAKSSELLSKLRPF